MPEPVTKAAGCICRSPQGRVLLLKRVDDGTWAWPGGKLKSGEMPEQAAWREVHEECSYRLGDVGKLLMRRVKDGVDYSTFIVDVPDEFVPVLNSEHSAWAWANPVELLNGDGEPDDLEPEAGRTILAGLDRLDARLAALGG